MRQAAGRLLLIVIFVLTIVPAVAAAPNSQDGALLPAILNFQALADPVGYAEVEAGTEQVTLVWNTLNTDDRHRVTLESFRQNAWSSLLAEGEVLPLSGSKEITLTLPENFGVPTYRLALRTAAGEIIDQLFVTLPYFPVFQTALPHVVAFTTEAQGVDTNLLIQNNVRLVVHWQIENRTQSTILRFDQVLADGSTVSAELPRRALWVQSSGTGVVVPRPSSSKNDLVFRLSLIEGFTGEVYDVMDLSVPVIGSVVIAAPGGNQTQANQGGQITILAAESNSVAPGGNVVLNWDAGDAENVDLLQTSEGGPTTLYIQLPSSGTMSVPLPQDSAGVTYTMRAYGAEGVVATGEVSVTAQSVAQGEGN